MISRIRKNRIAQYQHELNARDSAGNIDTTKRVYAQGADLNGKKFGFIVADGPDYYGEAGHSSRVWVLWADGRRTLCAIKGMKLIKSYSLVEGLSDNECWQISG